MTFTYTYAAHGYMFRAASDHRQHECTWCRQARETALSHMRDTTLKTTKSTKYEIPTSIPHTVHVTRMYGEYGGPLGFPMEEPVPPLVEQINFMDTTGKFGVSGTYVRQSEGLTLPVVLDLTEAEASAVLELLVSEWDHQTEEADAAYQNGDGFEGECVQARTLAADAVKIADRLRKALADHLDKAYTGKLES